MPGQPSEMAALRAKIAQLETSHKIQQTKQTTSHKLENERRDRQAEKMVAALENEKRDRQAEKREIVAAQEKKEMLTALENQKRDPQSQID